ncbi:unnamed protein product [Brassica rapa]|uniref:Uncharacterized protein n=1 Tax=Brassica campestris TaxID=3711 RepID=A0A8D9G265_BRACM|nr:unnamed protein product [Brassica rapa]
MCSYSQPPGAAGSLISESPWVFFSMACQMLQKAFHV